MIYLLVKWNFNKVNNMRSMFNGCKLLESLPDISKWNTENITNISFFYS